MNYMLNEIEKCQEPDPLTKLVDPDLNPLNIYRFPLKFIRGWDLIPSSIFFDWGTEYVHIVRHTIFHLGFWGSNHHVWLLRKFRMQIFQYLKVWLTPWGWLKERMCIIFTLYILKIVFRKMIAIEFYTEILFILSYVLLLCILYTVIKLIIFP